MIYFVLYKSLSSFYREKRRKENDGKNEMNSG